MKAFNYRARTMANAHLSGVVEANSRQEAIEKLREDGLVVESLVQASGERDLNIDLGSKTKDKNLSIMCNQMGIILKAGMPIVRTLELVAGQTEDKGLSKMLTAVADDVSAGYGLADSFAKHGPGLPETFVESIRAGEVSGTLEKVFERMGAYYNKTDKNKSRVRSALIYPVFVLALAVIVIAIIMIFAVPTFTSSFEQMNMELPGITKFLMASADWWTRYWWVVFAVIAIVVIALKLAQRNESFRLAWHRFLLRLPIMGHIVESSSASQYASTMSMMMDAGLPVLSAVDVTARSMSNYWMAKNLADTRVDLEAGRQLSTSLARTKAFPDMMVEMTGIGEQTGSLEQTLDVMADYYDNETETATTRALAVMEPALIIILAFIVGGILLAVYLPIFSLYGGLGTSI